jgi:hypothetical protein
MALNTAIRYLKKGEWAKAHAIVQQDEQSSAAGRTGIVHLVEGEPRQLALLVPAVRAGRFPATATSTAKSRNSPRRSRRCSSDRGAHRAVLRASGRRSPRTRFRRRARLGAANQDVVRPLFFNTVTGGWCNLLRVRRSGRPVAASASDGRRRLCGSRPLRYLEHDWVAEQGSFVYEPPGEIHTSVLPDDCAEMITFFNIGGAMIYVDDAGRQTGVRGRVHQDRCAARITRRCELGADYVDRFVR